MTTISVATTVKNEALNVEGLLATIEGIADELVVVNNGSTDDTAELFKNAKTSYPIRIYNERFEPPHFGKAFNAAIDRGEMDYVLFLEADHRLGPEFKSIKTFLEEKKPETVQFRLVDDVVPHFIAHQTRLFKKGVHYREDDDSAIHPVVDTANPPVSFYGPLYHLQGGKFKMRRKEHDREGIMMNVDRIERTTGRTREIVRGILAFYYLFKKIYFTCEAWRDGWNGFLYSYKKARYKFLIHFYVALKPRAVEVRL